MPALARQIRLGVSYLGERVVLSFGRRPACTFENIVTKFMSGARESCGTMVSIGVDQRCSVRCTCGTYDDTSSHAIAALDAVNPSGTRFIALRATIRGFDGLDILMRGGR